MAKKKLETVQEYEARRNEERRQLRLASHNPSGITCPRCDHELSDKGLIFSEPGPSDWRKSFPTARRLVCPECEHEEKVSL